MCISIVKAFLAIPRRRNKGKYMNSFFLEAEVRRYRANVASCVFLFPALLHYYIRADITLLHL